MKYKSCHLLEHGISIDIDSIKACCLSREFDKGELMIIDSYENNKIDWDKLFEIKKQHRLMAQKSVIPACDGCYSLREEEWGETDNNDYISYINFNHWSQCNSNCIYCNVQSTKPKIQKQIFESIKELIDSGRFRNNGEITFQGGEPTVLKDFEKLVKFFIKQKSKIRIHSSGILFSRAIRDGLKQGIITVVISPDSATKETYKKVKRVDKFNKVWDNIKHYRKGLKDDKAKLVKVKFIIIPGINDTAEEINEFLNKIKLYDIKSIIVDFEYTYANRNLNHLSPHVYMLLDYIENYAKENNIEFDLYDSAKNAVINRNIDKTYLNFEDLKTELNKPENLNIERNINY